MRRSLSLLCALALCANAAAQERPPDKALEALIAKAEKFERDVPLLRRHLEHDRILAGLGPLLQALPRKLPLHQRLSRVQGEVGMAAAAWKALAPGDPPAGSPSGIRPNLEALRALVTAADLPRRLPREAAYLLRDLGLVRERDAAIAEWLNREPKQRELALSLVRDQRSSAAPEPYEFHAGAWMPQATAGKLKSGLVLVGQAWWTTEQLRQEIPRARARRAKREPNPSWLAREAERRKTWAELGVQDVATVVWKGDLSRRMDITFLADGFQAHELPRFAELVDRVSADLLKVDPYATYRSHINIHRVDVASARSGAQRYGAAGDNLTPIGARVSQDQILTCDQAAARRYAKLAPAADLIVVIANVGGVRSTGGEGVITLDHSGQVDEVFLHELGHALAGLDDEYVDPTPAVRQGHPEWSAEREGEHVNTTRESDAQRVKWHYWNWPVSPAGPVGVFKGGYYRDLGYFRPRLRCIMRSHTETKDFCPVCMEELQRRFAAWLSPLESGSPRAETIACWQGEPLVFSAARIQLEPPAGTTHRVQVAWYLDGEYQEQLKDDGATTSLSLDSAAIEPGWHTVALRAQAENSRIRRDEALLSTARVWRLCVKAGKRPHVLSPERLVVADWGLPVEFTPRLDLPEPHGFRPTLADAPEGLYVDERTGRVCWVPRWNQRGLHRPKLRFVDGPHAVDASFEVLVGGAPHPAGPTILQPPAAWGIEGQDLVLPVPAIDEAGTRAWLDAEELPAGARWDPTAQELRWRPAFDQAGKHKLGLVARGGAPATDRVEIELLVLEGTPDETGAPDDDGLLRAIRSRNADRQRQALELLRQRPRTLQVMLGTQLLRARDQGVVRQAAEQIWAALQGEGPEPDPGPTSAPVKPGQTIEGTVEGHDVQTRRQLMRIFLRDIVPQVRSFTDAPDALALIAAACKAFPKQVQLKAGERKVLDHVQKELQAVREYNRSRGL